MSFVPTIGRPVRPSYPPAARQAVVVRRHGHAAPDPYRWLEDAASPQTRQWLTAQRELVDALSCDQRTLRTLRSRLEASTAVGAVSAPVWRGERQFVQRLEPRAERPAVHLIEPDGTSRVLLDPLVLDPDGRTSVDCWEVSWDGRLLSYQLSQRGTECSELHVLGVDSGQPLGRPIRGLRRAPVVWAPDSSGFWYIARLPPSGNDTAVAPRRLRWHRLGTDPADDPVVFGEELPDQTGLWPQLLTGRWLAIATTLGTSPANALWLSDLLDRDPTELRFHPVVATQTAVVRPIAGVDGQMYLRTTLGAPRGRVCVVDPTNLEELSPEHWRELIAEDSGSVLQSLLPVGGCGGAPAQLLVVRTRSGRQEVTVHDAETGSMVHDVTLPGPGQLLALACRPEGGDAVWFSYTDHSTPATVLRYDLRHRRTTVHAKPPGEPPRDGATRLQVRYESTEGALVALFLVAPPGCASGSDRPRPLLLTAYGGFGVSIGRSYQGDALPWVDSGGVVAVACVRGGGEEGQQWHQIATGRGKQRSVDDIHAAAEWLIAEGWTTPDQLALLGSSNGGLLVSAAMVQRPELYRAVAATAPLTDMIRYEDGGLGPLWRGEYGTVEDPDDFAALLAYSPYHQVRPGKEYPALLLTVFESDTRVDPMHSRKLCATLQYASRGTGPILLRSIADTGHGARSRRVGLDTGAEILGFLAEQTGLVIPGPAAPVTPGRPQ